MGSSKDHFPDFRVSLPGSRKYIREYLRENEIFSKNFWGIAQGLGTIDSCKKPDIKNLMLVSLRFHGDIREYISDFLLTIPGSQENDP